MRIQGSKDKKKRKNKVLGWTSADVNYLSEHYYKQTNKELCNNLNRSKSCIRTKARELGLIKPSYITDIDKIDALKNKCGVYGIYCINTNMYYIGSSVNIYIRLKNHMSQLDKSKHKNKALQLDWNNKYQFEIHLMACCDENDLLPYENQIISQLKKKYNSWILNQTLPNKPLIKKRLDSCINKGEENECWECKNVRKGYGVIRIQYREYYVHRLAFYLHYNYNPKGIIRHICNNKKCCNPKHLIDGSYSQNSKDYQETVIPGAKSILYKYKEDIIEMFKNGVSYKKIGEKYGVSTTTILLFLKRIGEYKSRRNSPSIQI